MLVVLQAHRDERWQWMLFQQDGSMIDLTNAPTVPDAGQRLIVATLSPGIYWLLGVTPKSITVRYYHCAHGHPMDASYTIESGITTEFMLSGRSVHGVREYMEEKRRTASHPELQYPQELIDAICDHAIGQQCEAPERPIPSAW